MFSIIWHFLPGTTIPRCLPEIWNTFPIVNLLVYRKQKSTGKCAYTQFHKFLPTLNIKRNKPTPWLYSQNNTTKYRIWSFSFDYFVDLLCQCIVNYMASAGHSRATLVFEITLKITRWFLAFSRYLRSSIRLNLLPGW